jgi:hypothetical protein
MSDPVSHRLIVAGWLPAATRLRQGLDGFDHRGAALYQRSAILVEDQAV